MKRALDSILANTIQRHKTPLPDYVIEVPNNPDHGHFATNLPLTLASSQKRKPIEIAGIIVDHLVDDGHLLEKVEIAGPGFINFIIRTEQWQKFLAKIIAMGREYGRSELGEGEKILVEYVSANPTGPLHLGHGRGAALGDTLCRILSFSGYEVVREFYINDTGQQMRLLGESVYSRWKQNSDPAYPFPENGYHGEYIFDLAKEVAEEIDLEKRSPDEAVNDCSERGKNKMLEEIKKDLAHFRARFDIWYREYEKDGALWIKTVALGDDKDRVVRKNDGDYTYFASDIAYHLDKWKRGFSKAINIWGADHHGYVQRIKAALKANGLDEDWLSVLLIQLVKLWKGGEEIKMSKRAGHYVTLKELVEEVGVDAVRFVFLTKNHDSPLDFDIDLVKKHDSENPVYYVQYAHARICSIFRKAESEGVSLPKICKTFEPHRLTYYLTELASSFHRYFNLGTKNPEHRIVCQDKALSQARLFLAEAVRIVLYNGLKLLGITAPERM
jgi:arginyl-tRNA synthetase